MQQAAIAQLPTADRQISRSDERLARDFVDIARRHNRRLFRIARGVLGDDAEAEDVVQEAYLRALSHLDDLNDQASLGAWLARITTNEALNRLRRRRASIPLADIAESAADTTSAATTLLSPFGRWSPEETAMHEEVRLLLEHAIDHLPVHFRSVFVACEVEGMSVADAAAALRLHLVTVKTRLYRARRLLRRNLGATFLSALPSAYPCAGARCDRIIAGVLARLAERTATEPARGASRGSTGSAQC